MFYYYTNGLSICSELYFPELTDFYSDQCDVNIRYGKVDGSLANVKYESAIWQSSGTDFLLNIEGVCNYYVKDNYILIDPVNKADEDAIRLYILSSIVPLFLYQKNYVSLHGACVAKDKGAILFCGSSGAGKSTTALGFHKRGYEILNDDVSSIFLDNSSLPHVSKGYLQLKLLPNSLEKYGYKTQYFNRLKKDWDKFSYPVKRTSHVLSPVPIVRIFFLEAEDQPNITHEYVEGLQAFAKLRVHTFRYWMARELNKLETHFKVCSSLIHNIPMVVVRRPVNIEPSKLVDYIEVLIKEKKSI